MNPLEHTADFLDRFEGYAFDLAKRQNAEALELLFRTFPWLLTHKARRYLTWIAHDWGIFSMPWAIIAADRHAATPYSAETLQEPKCGLTPQVEACLVMLQRVGFQPDGHFLGRLFRSAEDELVLRFLELFGITADFVPYDSTFSALEYAEKRRSKPIHRFLHRELPTTPTAPKAPEG